jgi:hypothetical protein
MQQIADRQRSLAVGLDAQRDVINGLLNRLTLAQDETASVADRTVTRLADGAQSIIRNADSIDARTQAALANMQIATEAFGKEAEAIETQAKQAELQAQSILASASGLHHQIYDLRTSMQNDGERATEVLAGLFNRITVGGGEVRDAGVAAEATLVSLQRVMGEQTGELYTSMQKIGERQRSLTESLEQQRETIGSLIVRFASAQDETAALAERTADRINDGAQKIASSLDLIGASATTTVATVTESISAFGDQVTALNMQSQQAEQQIRGVLSVTAGMQEQARHLREAMQVETARAVEHLSTIIATLDSTGQKLKTESDTAVATLDQTAELFITVTDKGAETLRGHLRLVSDAGDRAEAQTRTLADASEFATTRLAALRDTLGASVKDGTSFVELTTKRIETVKNALQEQLQHLSAFSQQAVQQVAVASESLASESDRLNAKLAASESALSGAADLVREEAKYLPATLNRGVESIEAASGAIKDNVAAMDQALVQSADRFISVTSMARNHMAEEMQRVSVVAEDAGAVLARFNEMLGEQVAAMQKNSAMLTSEQQMLVEKASQSVGELTAAGTRLETLRNEAASTAERLVQEFTMLDQRATASNDRLVQAGNTITRQAEAIGEVAARAETKIAGVSDGLRDQLEHIRAGMQTQIDDINRGLMQITAQLERTGTSLRNTAVGAVADVERVGQRFEQTGGEAVAQVDARTQQMRNATDEVAKLLGGYSQQFDTMLRHMAEAGTGIKHQESDMLTHLQSMLGHLGTVAEKLESARTLSGDVSQHAIERLDTVVNAIQAQMNNMTAGAQTAAGIMRGIGQIYSDQTGALTKGVGDAHAQVLTMNQSIDDMQARTDRMRAALKMQGDDLMNSLRQILSQLEMTGDGLSEAVDRTLQEQASAGLKKIS